MNNALLRPIRFTNTDMKADSSSNYPQALSPVDYDYVLSTQLYAEKKQIDFQEKVALEQIKQEHKKEIDTIRFSRKLNRENASSLIFRNADDLFCIEVRVPGEKTTYKSFPITKSCIKAYKVFSTEDQELEHLLGFIFIADKKRKKYISCEDITPNKISRLFKDLEICITVGRDRKKAIAEHLFDFLIKEAEIMIIPPSYGWHKRNGSWTFFTDNDITLSEVIK